MKQSITKIIAQKLVTADFKDTLIVVDVQEAFLKSSNNHGFDESLVDKIRALARTYKQVYQVHDTNITDIPSYEFPNQVRAIPKNYGFDLQREDIPSYFGNNADYDAIMNLDYGTGIETNDGRYLLRTSGEHEWFLLDEDLFQFLTSLKGKHADLVGGANNECLTDVFEAALALGVNAEILYDYIY